MDFLAILHKTKNVTLYNKHINKKIIGIQNYVYIPFSIPSVILPETLFLPFIVMLLGLSGC